MSTPSPSIEITYWPEGTPDREVTGVIEPPAPGAPLSIVPLAARFAQLARDLDRAEVELENLLADLFPGWAPRFPRHLSLVVHPPGGLEVWDASGSPSAMSELVLAGFTRIKLHVHPAARPLICRCPVIGPAA